MSACLKQFGKSIELKGAVSQGATVYTAVIVADGKEFTIRTNFDQYTSQDLGRFQAAKEGVRYTNQEQAGWTSGNNPTLNHIASNVALATEAGTYKSQGFFALFFHEMGNAIAGKLYSDAYQKPGADRSKLDNPFSLPIAPTEGNDRDSGTKFERCLYGGIVGLSDGRVGNSRHW